MSVPFPSGDQQLVQIIDLALADTARRSGEWLVCKPGCAQCCVGAFAINQLDALRLQQGFAELEMTDPDRAAQVRKIVHARRLPGSRRTSPEILRPAFWMKARPRRRSSKSLPMTNLAPFSIPRLGCATCMRRGR